MLWCAEGSFDAFLSGPARFALFVFNDASREADSHRVERTAFDVSDYDITDVQSRRAEEWGSVLAFFFFFFTSQWHFIQREREKEGRVGQRHTEGEEVDLAKNQNVILCSQIFILFLFVGIVVAHKNNTGEDLKMAFLEGSCLTCCLVMSC